MGKKETHLLLGVQTAEAGWTVWYQEIRDFVQIPELLIFLLKVAYSLGNLQKAT